MNIKNRLERIEMKSKIKDGFCDCQGTAKHEIKYEGFKSESLQDTSIGNYCEKCRRKINKQTIIVEFVESKI